MSEIMKELSVYPVILEQTAIVVFLLEFLSHHHRNPNQDHKAIHLEKSVLPYTLLRVAWLKLFSRNLGNTPIFN